MTAIVSLTTQEKSDLCVRLRGWYNSVQGGLATLETQLAGSEFAAFTVLKHNEAVVSYACCDQWADGLDAFGLTMADVFPSSDNTASPHKPVRPV